MTARAVPTATLDHDTVRESLEFIAQGLRQSDLDEMRATLGPVDDPFWPLFESWEASVASWLIIDPTGLPVGIAGVAAHVVPKLGMAWLMGTDGLTGISREFIRQTPAVIAEMHRYFPALVADVDARNELSMRWLEWAGFTIADANPAYGPEERLFIKYVRTA